MPKNVLKAVAGLGAAGVIAVSGAALASSETPSGSASGGVVTTHGHHHHHHHGHHHGKPVTGATLAQVKAAIKAKDASVTVERVFQGPKGDFHAMGTQGGKRVHVEVSKDMKTVTVKTGGPGMRGGDHKGGRGMHRGTPVTGATLTKVESAIKAKDASVTVERVFQGPKGNFHAMGTQGGKRVHIDVSKDMKTVTVKTGGHGQHRPGGQAPAGSAAASA